MAKVIVLDAMGVMYQADDDVEELLVPFIVRHGGVTDVQAIQNAYHQASLGALDPNGFWHAVAMDPAAEDRYLALHELRPGLVGFLDRAQSRGVPVWCLSNDVSRWSAKLRLRFDLERRFAGFVISGDIGARKPDPIVYRELLERVACKPPSVLFVDDREANVASAQALGIDARIFEGFDELALWL